MSEIKASFPTPTACSEPFWDGCNRGELLLCHCCRCDHVFYYPRLMCPRCAGRELDWRNSTGRGKIHSHSTVHISFYGDEWESQLPYTVLLVDLEEGPRMLSRLAGSSTNEVRTGAPVMVEFVSVEDRKLPFFRLSGDRTQERPMQRGGRT